MKVDNEIYESRGNGWWDDHAGFEFTSLRYCVNPVRYGYFKRKMQLLELTGRAVLDIGCGGGLLAEEFAKDGFVVTGLDPAVTSVTAARNHARKNKLDISYQVGRGEALPHTDHAFDIVTCCDVLEHVDDPSVVLSEVSRVLKPGGIFFFDTINRTWQSKLVMIKLLQEWTFTRLLPANTHVWEQFIKPVELVAMMQQHNLINQEMKGMGTGNSFAMLQKGSAIKSGKVRNQELAAVLSFCESENLTVSYMGFSVKQ